MEHSTTSPQAKAKAKKPWIMVTDDSKTICYMLRAVGHALGCETREMVRLLDLSQILRDDPPSIVVLDLERPGDVSGAAIGHFIRHYQAQHIPMLVFSSKSADERRKVREDIGADETLGKDESLTRLQGVLEALLAMSQEINAPRGSGVHRRLRT